MKRTRGVALGLSLCLFGNAFSCPYPPHTLSTVQLVPLTSQALIPRLVEAFRTPRDRFEASILRLSFGWEPAYAGYSGLNRSERFPSAFRSDAVNPDSKGPTSSEPALSDQDDSFIDRRLIAG